MTKRTQISEFKIYKCKRVGNHGEYELTLYTIKRLMTKRTQRRTRVQLSVSDRNPWGVANDKTI